MALPNGGGGDATLAFEQLKAAALAEFLSSAAVNLFEGAREMTRVGEAQLGGNFLGRIVGMQQARFGHFQPRGN